MKEVNALSNNFRVPLVSGNKKKNSEEFMNCVGLFMMNFEKHHCDSNYT
jgi:hypothetical protein